MVEDWTGEAYRVLAIAAGPPGELGLLGLVALADPVRPEARAAVLAARAAGIRPVMVTGDHPSTAAAVAARTGVTDAAELPTAPDAPLRPVYARIDPAEKLGIITAWRRAGHVVAMTGDGVNDAPALRAADVGVAMGVRGTEVAKQAADVVLTDDSLSTIVAAVAEGRRVFDNVRRFVRYGVAGGLAELIVMLMGPFLGLALPLLPAQILWINLLTHGLPGVAFGAEQAEPDVLSRPPRPPTDGVLSKRGWWEVLTLAAAIATSCLLLACWLAALHRPWQTPLFGTLPIGQLGVALTTRSALRPVWRTPAVGQPVPVRRGRRKPARRRRGHLVPTARRAARHRSTDGRRRRLDVGGRNRPRRRRRAHEGATASGRRDRTEPGRAADHSGRCHSERPREGCAR